MFPSSRTVRVTIPVSGALLWAGMLACGDAPRAYDQTSGVSRQGLEAGHASAEASETVALEADAAETRDLFTCEADDDCIAVPKAGLCRNGVKEAVNRHRLEDYRKAFAHVRRGACTFLLIRDRRVARCDHEQGRCVLAAAPSGPHLPMVFPPPGGPGPSPHRPAQ